MARKGWDKQVVVGEVKKTESTIVRVSYVEGTNDEGETYKGIDIREFYKKKGQTEYNPSPKGLVVAVDKIEDLTKLVAEAVKEAEDKPKRKKATRKKVTK
jgi:hypothetical protein